MISLRSLSTSRPGGPSISASIININIGLLHTTASKPHRSERQGIASSARSGHKFSSSHPPQVLPIYTRPTSIPLLAFSQVPNIHRLKFRSPPIPRVGDYRSYTAYTSSTMVVTRKDIISNIPERFTRANDSGDLLFFPSTVYKHEEQGVEFEIRLCPALQRKPSQPPPPFNPADAEAEKIEEKQFDPFAPPYNPNLVLGELKDEEEDAEYIVLFNKFSVVPHHILLVTKEFQSQTAPLLPCDLVQTYQLLLEAQNNGRRFFAFYNCGNLSGASQPHKHLQLLPIEDDGPPVEKLAKAAKLEVPDRPFSISTLPYANHIRRLPTNLSLSTPTSELSDSLSAAFISLLDLAISTIRHDPTYPSGPPSYNVILTLSHMHLIPRKEETYLLGETKEKLNVNALGFAGMLLVKSESELEAVRKEGVGKILSGVGVGSVHEFQVKDIAAEAEDYHESQLGSGI